MKVENQINQYLNNEITLWGVVEKLVEFEVIPNNTNTLNNATKFIINNESDKGMIAALLLWCMKDSPVKSLNETSNSFINFLLTIRDKDSSFYNQKIEWIYTDNHSCTFKKDNLLFVINDEFETKRMQLPDEFCDKTILCINCNEELKVSYFVDVPATTFYIIEVVE